MLLWRELLDPKYGMFKEYEETKRLWFNSDSLEETSMYMLIGLLCGLAIYNQTIIDLPFPTTLYKKLLQEIVDLSDMEDLSPIIAKYVVFCCMKIISMASSFPSEGLQYISLKY